MKVFVPPKFVQTLPINKCRRLASTVWISGGEKKKNQYMPTLPSLVNRWEIHESGLWRKPGNAGIKASCLDNSRWQVSLIRNRWKILNWKILASHLPVPSAFGYVHQFLYSSRVSQGFGIFHVLAGDLMQSTADCCHRFIGENVGSVASRKAIHQVSHSIFT